MILVSGATGANGAELVKLLSSIAQRSPGGMSATRTGGVPLRAMARSRNGAEAIAALPGVELVGGDFDDLASLGRALAGVERAFLLTPSTDRAEAQQLAFVAAARGAGVRHVVKLSQFAADEGSPVRFLRYHAAVERAVRESGMAWTFLRPNLFMQGLLGFSRSITTEGKFYAAAGDARVSVVDVRDNAAAAAAALTEGGHEGRTYDLTGPEALTHAEMAAKLSEATGRAVSFVDIPPDAMGKALVGMGMPPWQADGLVEDYAHYRRGEAAALTSGVQDATGRRPGDFAGFARDYAPAFS